VSKRTDPPGLGSLAGAALTALSTLVVTGFAAVVGIVIAREFGRSDETDGFFAAYGVFIVLALAGVSFDGLQETAAGAALLSALLPPIQALFGLTSTTFLLLDTLALVVVALAFGVAFGLIVGISHAVADPERLVVRTPSGWA